jgi:hypothetical protein
MVKRLYDWITKANQVLLFLFIIGATLLISYLVYDARRRFEPPHVPIAQSAEEAKGSVVQDVVFLGQSSGIYVLGLMKRVVVTGESPWVRLPSSSLGNEEVGYPGEMVNVVFSRGEQPIRTLLQNDGLILSNNVFAQYRSEKTKASLFLCVTDDTDGNHRLDRNDRNDLYVVSEELERPDLVVKGVSDYRLISTKQLIVKTGENNVIRFWDIDVETQAKKEIAWK